MSAVVSVLAVAAVITVNCRGAGRAVVVRVPRVRISLILAQLMHQRRGALRHLRLPRYAFVHGEASFVHFLSSPYFGIGVCQVAGFIAPSLFALPV
jgi:hypothetical protein